MSISSAAPCTRSWTEKQGVNQRVIVARNAVMDSFGVKIDDSIIEQILRTGTADIGKPYDTLA
ncbi:MAG: hypothetical protein IJ438_01670 [Clostridia bacterium]|nr:hypothetical protein [Clostridia bacterium]